MSHTVRDLESRIQSSPQYREGKFHNVTARSPKFSTKDFFVLLWKVFFQTKGREPKKKLPSQTLRVNEGQVGAYLTWFGHSTFFYQVDGKKILFDPMLSRCASPIPGMVKRYHYDLPATAESLPELDAVVVTHDHYDHLDKKTVKQLVSKTKLFIVPLGVGKHLRAWGVDDQKIVELDWWESAKVDGVSIISVPSQHFSGRGLRDSQQTLWSAYVVESSTRKVFFGGDSGYWDGFKEISERCGPFDLTLLDSGQYNEMWEVVHMRPEQSVQAHLELGGKTFMPIHWSAFTLALHTWTDPVERALLAAREGDIEMITPMIGECFEVGVDKPQKKWWRD